MKTIGVTGGNGLLGTKILHTAEGKYQTVSIDLQEEPFWLPKKGRYVTADISNQQIFFEKLSPIPLEGIINTAAFTNVDGCETQKERAYAVNAKGVESVARFCAEKKIRLIHVSTDYVFDGKNGPYDEEAKPHPVSFYGKTKLDGEVAVQKLLDNFVIARTTVLYGYMPNARLNFVTWLIAKLSKGESVQIVNSQWGNPTLADDLASALFVLFESGLKGIYNTVGRDWLNRFEFAKKIVEIFELDDRLIQPIPERSLKQPAARPAKGGLTLDKIQSDTDYQFLSVKESLEKMKQQMVEDGVWPPA